MRSTYSNSLPPPYTVHRLPLQLPEIQLELFRHNLLSASSTAVACVLPGNGRFFSFSLFTGVSSRVKKSPLMRRDIVSSLRYGSGYDPSEDDYKIMVVCAAKDLQEPLCPFWEYSFKNRSWKSFDGFPYASYGWRDHTCARRQAYSFNGVLHWLSTTTGEVRNEVVVTYDLHSHQFGEFPVPYCASFGSLTELDGQLCIIYRMSDEWVMERYCVGGYWTKLFSFDPLKIKIVFRINQIVYSALYVRGGVRKVSFLMFGRNTPRMISYNLNRDMIKAIDRSEYRRDWDLIQLRKKLKEQYLLGESGDQNKSNEAKNRQKGKKKASGHKEHKGKGR